MGVGFDRSCQPRGRHTARPRTSGRAVWAASVVAVAASLAAAEPPSLVEAENRRCYNCHGQNHIATLSPADRLVMVARTAREGPVGATRPSGGARPAETTTAPATRPGLYVTGESLVGSVHAGLTCVECHASAAKLPHSPKPPRVDCSSCHAKPQGDFLRGTHAEVLAKGDSRAPTCTTCHGSHKILPKSDRQSSIYPLNIVKVCGDCHQKHRGDQPKGGRDKPRISAYLESVHGHALTKGGLIVSATCGDCHGYHRVLPARNPDSLVHRDKVPGTCGQCHVGLSEIYQKSIHGQKLAAGDPKAPTCTDCHAAHAISRTTTPAFRLDIVNECGQCHDQPPPGSTRQSSLYDTYRLSYHGQVTALGFARGARCSDCHGAHDIRRLDDPASSLSDRNRVETCRKCHPKANARFAQFEAHADFRDARRYPILHAVWLYFVIVMSSAFGFFGLHSLLWLGRSIIERVRHGPHPKRPRAPYSIQRFTQVDRINHGLMVISFFGLTLTGLPLLYADQTWGRSLADALGGVLAAGLLHRLFAIMLLGNFVVHFGGLARRMRKGSLFGMLFGPTTMLPRWKDVQDCAGMFRWFFRGGKRPDFDRWAYWEKFDYMAEIGGSMIIGLSGLLLWFPQFFAQFLPGWVFNIAMLVHGYEALLAIVFIFTIHFFNANLRPEKFPVDDVIFTGQLSEEEFRLERGAEYERLVADGTIDRYRVPTAPRWWRKLAVVIGLAAMLVGGTLAALIILATLKVI